MAPLIQIRNLSRTPIAIGDQRLTLLEPVTVDLEDPKVRKDLLTYKGQWIPDVEAQIVDDAPAASVESITLAQLSDVSDDAPADGNALVWDDGDEMWKPGASSGLPNLNDLTAVDPVNFGYNPLQQVTGVSNDDGDLELTADSQVRITNLRFDTNVDGGYRDINNIVNITNDDGQIDLTADGRIRLSPNSGNNGYAEFGTNGSLHLDSSADQSLYLPGASFVSDGGELFVSGGGGGMHIDAGDGDGPTFASLRLRQVADPTDAQDAATKQFVLDNMGGGGGNSFAAPVSTENVTEVGGDHTFDETTEFIVVTNSQGAERTFTLPAAPPDGTVLVAGDAGGHAGNNPIHVVVAGGGNIAAGNESSAVQDYLIRSAFGFVAFVWHEQGGIWYVLWDSQPNHTEIKASRNFISFGASPYSIDIDEHAMLAFDLSGGDIDANLPAGKQSIDGATITLKLAGGANQLHIGTADSSTIDGDATHDLDGAVNGFAYITLCYQHSYTDWAIIGQSLTGS